jgi:hypothetical protein
MPDKTPQSGTFHTYLHEHHRVFSNVFSNKRSLSAPPPQRSIVQTTPSDMMVSPEQSLGEIERLMRSLTDEQFLREARKEGRFEVYLSWIHQVKQRVLVMERLVLMEMCERCPRRYECQQRSRRQD